jgi:hypothetical protein
MSDDEERIYGEPPQSEPVPASTPATPPAARAAKTSLPRSPSTVRRRRGVYIGAGIGAAIIVIVLALWLAGVGPFAGQSPINRPTVTVTAATLSFTPSSNPCFASDYGTTTPGTLATGGTYIFSAKLTSDAAGSARYCTVKNLTITSPGFTIASANVPLFVPASGGALLNVSITVPSTAYEGQLNITAGVTFTLPGVTVKNLNGYYSPSNLSGPCGATPALGGGFTTWSHNDFNASVGFIVYSAADACEISNVTTNTTGFTVLNPQVPYVLPVDNFGGVSFVLLTPTGTYDGNVSIILDLVVLP